jgi:hypothetical protein
VAFTYSIEPLIPITMQAPCDYATATEINDSAEEFPGFDLIVTNLCFELKAGEVVKMEKNLILNNCEVKGEGSFDF